ncbi:uncharacterized protein B0I36DRAFT_298276 [Microdochium trichocladiopsis]|uniref:Luciferase domain-containing protein n=1 Tax=Microdochium trichocladiopsis TaxID=1682393 RepID=A0A9P9BN90_9PEZI|nr:uncharacterized protein B0I36DRAFT_298276 [Microdochium trichocladiopsis]KAH7018587.1 hypothetical protein B0I36DRAFT_298276 [Microdochium trichocladiopsis]
MASGLHLRLETLRWPVVATSVGTSLLAAFAAWCYHDYQEYLALGPGGPPYSLRGWAWITFGIRPFALSKSGATLVADYPNSGAHDDICQLPKRQGDRALLGGIAPHRQLSQRAPRNMEVYLTNLLNNAAKQYPDSLKIKKSLYERHHDALFVAPSLLQQQAWPPSSTDEACCAPPECAHIARGEIGHVHPDLSVHLYLSPADARQVIEKTWAERHRLAVPTTSWVKNKYAIADTYLMIYGPRDESEMEVLSIILANSIRYMTGKENVGHIEWRSAL